MFEGGARATAVAGVIHLLMTTISGPSVSIMVAHRVRVAFEAFLTLSNPSWCISCKHMAAHA